MRQWATVFPTHSLNHNLLENFLAWKRERKWKTDNIQFLYPSPLPPFSSPFILVSLQPCRYFQLSNRTFLLYKSPRVLLLFFFTFRGIGRFGKEKSLATYFLEGKKKKKGKVQPPSAFSALSAKAKIFANAISLKNNDYYFAVSN